MTETKYTGWLAIFEEMCRANKAVSHSDSLKRWYPSIDEYIGNKLDQLAVICVPAPSRLKDGKSDNVHKLYEFDFWILQTCPKNDFKKQREIYDNTEAIADDFIKYLYMKSGTEGGFDNRIISYFHPDEANSMPIGPVENNAYGFSLRVVVGNPFYIRHIDPLRWLKTI